MSQPTCPAQGSPHPAVVAVNAEQVGIQAAFVLSQDLNQMGRAKAKPGVRQLEASQSHIDPRIGEDPGDTAVQNEAPSHTRSLRCH